MAGIPLKLNGSETSGVGSSNPTLPADTPVYTLKEMSSSEIDDGIIYPILKEFAKTTAGSPLTGELTLSDTVGNIATNSVGIYVDTTRIYGVGSKGSVTATTESETTLYQVLTTVVENVIRPLCFRDGAIREMTDTEIMDTIITPALQRMTNRGLGSYHFSNGTPKDTNGTTLSGTWTSLFTVRDYYKGGNIATNWVNTYINNTVQPPTGPSVRVYNLGATSYNTSTVYTLWRKTAETEPVSPKRPLKYANTSERGKHIAEMTNADILSLVSRFRNQIVSTGIGRYALQQNSPTAGTWARRGDRIADLLNTIESASYVWIVAGQAQRAYTGYFSSTYTSTFAGAYAKVTRTTSSGSSQAFYNTWYAGTYSRVSTRPEASAIVKSFINVTLATSTIDVVSPTTAIQSSDYLYVKRAN